MSDMPTFPPPGEAYGYRDRHNARRIGVLHPWGDDWRLTSFAPDGPTGHYDIADGDQEKLKTELRWGTFERDDSALEDLEQWTQTPEWERGIKGLYILMIWNRCSYQGRGDLCGEISDYAAEHTQDETLAWLPTIIRRLRKEGE
jgi:hypothetical protein